ncbi:hypothetical protein ISN44_As13g015300, partial [Arabidopsis suecica]
WTGVYITAEDHCLSLRKIDCVENWFSAVVVSICINDDEEAQRKVVKTENREMQCFTKEHEQKVAIEKTRLLL